MSAASGIVGSKVLVVENTAWTPHLETGIEIALDQREAGRDVHYLCVRGLGAFFEDRPLHRRSMLRLNDVVQYKNWRAADLLQQRGITVHRCRHRRDHAAVPVFPDLASLKQYREDDWDLGMGVASSLISATRWSAPDLDRYRGTLQRMVRAARLAYRNVRELVATLRPDAVVLFNGRFLTCRAAMRAAQAEGCRVVIHERGCDKDHYELFDFLPHDLGKWSAVIGRDSAEVPTEVREAAAKLFYGRRRAGGAKDWVSFVHWSQGDLGAHEPLRAQRPVVYFSSSDDEFTAVGEDLPQPLFDTQMEAAQCLAKACEEAGLPLVVRLHPHLAKKHPEDLAYWRRGMAGRATVIDAEEKVDSYSLMEAASICVTYGSTTGIEALYWGRPHLLLGRAPYEGLPGVVLPPNREAIKSLLMHPPAVDRSGAIRFGWYTETFGRRFRHFDATTLFKGSIIGSPLRKKVHLGEALRIIAARMTRRLRPRSGRAAPD